MGKRRVAEVETPPSGPLYHVIRRDYFGDPGKQVGSNVSKERAEEYVEEMQGCERADFEIVRA